MKIDVDQIKKDLELGATNLRAVNPQDQEELDRITKIWDEKSNLFDAVATELNPNGETAMNTPLTEIELEYVLQKFLPEGTKIDRALYNQLKQEVWDAEKAMRKYIGMDPTNEEIYIDWN